ncbi:penicillin-binding transpeptidase domain-containing protein [Actinomadura welshii]|uniref:Cell division protein FtsI (Penicillin-binding protein 3) n=2 Tax=Actinomadura livida TaxID=79909 RepID=A0A7W7IFV1_9ACTN|nr:penicillin-binding protein 2 [Actinomadura catellatispora]MBB4776353.1 cell division protein FtsI (penicillin-binding protein 3) [Actinomadura catellatispora]
MTKPPGRGTSGPPPGRGRGPDGRGSRGPADRDAGGGPGAARASGRRAGNPPRPAGGRSDGAGRPGTKGGAARRPARNPTVPAPRKETGRKETGGKSTGGKGTGAGGTSAKKPAEKKARSRPAPKKAPRKSSPGRSSPARSSPAKSAASRAVRTAKGARPAGGGPRGPRPGGGSGRRPPGRGQWNRVPFHRRDPLKRLNVALLVVAFVLSLFAGRLVQLQTIEAGTYTEQAMRQRLHKIELPAIRGDITDAQGHPLAMTVEARAITADPSLIKAEKRQSIVNALAPTLDLDPAALMQKISKPDTRFVYLAHGVPPDQARLITSWDFPGIGTLPEYRREYPNDSLAASVIGFVNDTGKGAAGLESSLDGMLAGRAGWQRVEISLDGQHIPMGEDQKRPSEPGRGVRLTLERDLQFKAQEAIEKQVEASGAKSGSVIVMDPRTGELLAMASAPGFDPNEYTKSDKDLWGSPLVQEAFEPGSTGKVVTAAAVMEKGGVTPQTPYTVPDKMKKYDVVFRDSHPHPTERLTFAGVLATSSNVGTIMASESIGQQELYQTLRDFGFGRKTGLPLPGETPGLLKPPAQWSGTDRYPIAFGQTVSVNAVQMASVYATIANGGVRVAPTLVAGTVGEDDAFTPSPAPDRRRVISERTARQISDMLEGVTTDEGTAPKAQIKGYRVAGKTGTAEVVNPRCGCYDGGGYTASFAGFAPADDPQLVVQVVLQNPKRGSHYGGDAAAPVFKDVMSFALKSEKIPPTGSRPPIIQIHARD